METNHLPRRKFIGIAAATTAAIHFPAILRGQNTANQQELKIGLVGCGGRGTGAASQALSADPNVKLWAVADAFSPAVQSSLANLASFGPKVDVPESRRFTGLDAFQKLIESGVDIVLLASPPAFRPQHLRACIEAGKHVFSEKPMAVDIAGVKSVLGSAKLAKQKNISIQHGYCWRFDPGVRAAYGKITSGELGRVISVYGTYMGTPPKPLAPGMVKPEGISDVEWQLTWWTNFEWLSGGPLLEQCVHTVDKVAWAMGDIAPIAAVASGGRAMRTDAGNVYDHYNIAYEYPGGVFCHVGERQYPGLHSETIDRIFCEKGTVLAPDKPFIQAPGSTKRLWTYRPKDGEEPNMYQVCHNEFFAALRKGETISTGEYMASSTMLGILGREAAHTGLRITWDELWEKNQDMAPDSLTMDDAFPIAPVPAPGVYTLT